MLGPRWSIWPLPFSDSFQASRVRHLPPLFKKKGGENSPCFFLAATTTILPIPAPSNSLFPWKALRQPPQGYIKDQNFSYEAGESQEWSYGALICFEELIKRYQSRNRFSYLPPTMSMASSLFHWREGRIYTLLIHIPFLPNGIQKKPTPIKKHLPEEKTNGNECGTEDSALLKSVQPNYIQWSFWTRTQQLLWQMNAKED